MSRKWPETLVFGVRHARIAIMACVVLLVAACGSIPGSDYFGFGTAPPRSGSSVILVGQAIRPT